MSPTGEWVRIEVRVRPGQTDPAGVAAQHDLELAGLNARNVRVHQVYYLKGVADAERVARELFVDPVLEGAGSATPWKVPEWPSRSASDPV